MPLLFEPFVLVDREAHDDVQSAHLDGAQDMLVECSFGQRTEQLLVDV